MKIESPIDIAPLVEAAKSVRERAVAPYSHFKVGAVARTTSGKIYTGCNIENATFSLTLCAERLAIFKGLAESDDAFSHIVIVADTTGPCYPCGSCRQIISEYAPSALIVCANLGDALEIFHPDDLLPNAFTSIDFHGDR